MVLCDCVLLVGCVDGVWFENGLVGCEGWVGVYCNCV